ADGGGGPGGPQRHRLSRPVPAPRNLALAGAMSTPLTLYVLTGLPGSGKSRRAAEIVAATGAVHVSMDDALRERGISIVDYDARFALQPQIEASIPRLLEQGHSVVAEFG